MVEVRAASVGLLLILALSCANITFENGSTSTRERLDSLYPPGTNRADLNLPIGCWRSVAGERASGALRRAADSVAEETGVVPATYEVCFVEEVVTVSSRSVVRNEFDYIFFDLRGSSSPGNQGTRHMLRIAARRPTRRCS